MDFWFDVTTPANTLEKDAIITELKLTAGTIVTVWLLHPEGCQGLAHATISEGGHQAYPYPPGSSYHGNSVPMIFEDNYEVEAPATLTLKTWNLDDTYEHIIFVRITLIRREDDPLIIAQINTLRAIETLLHGQRVPIEPGVG